jgi:hypothetical protein
MLYPDPYISQYIQYCLGILIQNLCFEIMCIKLLIRIRTLPLNNSLLNTVCRKGSGSLTVLHQCCGSHADPDPFLKIKNCSLLSPGFQKGRPSYRRSLQPSKRTYNTSKHEISSLFSIFVGYFCPPGSVSNINADPDRNIVLHSHRLT